MSTGDLDLAAITRRTNAASEGPWTAHPDGLVWSTRAGDPVSGSALFEDAEFIAHARTDVPALLGVALRLAKDNAELEREVEDLRQALGRIRVELELTETERLNYRQQYELVRDELRAWRSAVSDSPGGA